MKILIESPTYHSLERLRDRMKELEYNNKQIKLVLNKTLQLTRRSKHKSEAIRLFTIDRIHGVPWSDVSNGDEVWAIIRNNKLITVMFRRGTQPKTADALRVDKVSFA